MISRRSWQSRILLFLLLLVASSGFAGSLPAVPVTLRHYSSTNRIPDVSIQSIYEDKIGILWLGVESSGLVKFDGKSYTYYKNDPEDSTTLTSNYPLSILEDRDGYIWVATHSGLNKLDRFTDRVKRYVNNEKDANSITSNSVNKIIADKNGRLWFGTTNGVNILVPGTDNFIHFLHNTDSLRPSLNTEITNMHIDAMGNIWIGTNINGLFMVGPDTYNMAPDKWAKSINQLSTENDANIKNWPYVATPNDLNQIKGLASTKDADTLWVSSTTGLYILHQKTGRIERYSFSSPGYAHLSHMQYYSLLLDNENVLWAGTANSGLVVINLNTGNTSHLYAEEHEHNQLMSNAIRDIIESRDGLIWIATKFAGLHYYDKRQRTIAHVKKGGTVNNWLSDNFVLSICAGGEDDLWVGTKQGGLCRYDRSTFTYKWYLADGKPGSLLSNRVEAIAEEENGTIWVGTDEGLYEYIREKDKFVKHLHQYVKNIYITDDGYIWIGAPSGLFRFSITEKKLSAPDSKHKGFFNTQGNLSISRVMKDSRGVLWIGTNSNGLYEYHEDTDYLKNHMPNKADQYSISGNQVRAIYEDKLGRLWIGTKSDGLNLYDRGTGRFFHKSSPRNLPSNTVYNILEDSNGRLWMGTHSGISMYNPNKEMFVNFADHHGLQGLIFESNAFAKNKQGKFFMGGANGMNVFSPDEITYKTQHPPLIITKFEIYNKLKDKDIFQFKRYELSRQDNYISFEFAILDYTDPQENQFAYMLEPFDNDWVYSENRNFASYTNLPPGTYRFKVKGANSDKVWNDDPMEIEIVIPAPIWEKAWFFPLVLVLIVTILFIVWQMRVSASRRRENILKKEVAERTQDLEEAYHKLEESNRQIEKHNRALRLQRDRITRQNLELKAHRQNLELMVAERTKDLEEAKDKAEESDRLKSAFLANMSHEIRTPLNAIMGFIDILEANELDPEERKTVNAIIQTNSDNLLQLINDIIDISIIEANQLVIRKKEFDFHAFLYEIEMRYNAHKDLRNKDVAIIREIPDGVEELNVYSDQMRLRQIYNNLINNAIKFTDRGHIKFGYKLQDQDTLLCFVEDTGIGISEENINKIFRRFHKIEPTAAKVHRGTGLGLSISKNLSELLGGRIWVDSIPGNGSTFFFTIPIR